MVDKQGNYITMVDKEHHFPRQGNIPMPSVYSTLDKFGDPIHTLYGGKLDLGGCRAGAGTWWPDFGPTVRDFSPGGVNHPTEFVFQSEVLPLTAEYNSRSQPNLLPRGKEQDPSHPQYKHVQFRHPDPGKEALWKSVDIMPYKPGGRRKCGEVGNWRAALSTGREGFRHGGRMPIWCKGPLLEDPDFHQKHPLKRDETAATIHGACLKEELRAGGATGTSPVDCLLLTTRTSKSLGLRDCEAYVAEKSMKLGKNVSHSQTFKAANSRLNGHIGSDELNARVETFTTFRGPQAKPRKAITYEEPDNASVGSGASMRSAGAIGDGKLPSWIAQSHVATRDPGAAGGQASSTAIRRTKVAREGYVNPNPAMR